MMTAHELLIASLYRRTPKNIIAEIETLVEAIKARRVPYRGMFRFYSKWRLYNEAPSFRADIGKAAKRLRSIRRFGIDRMRYDLAPLYRALFAA